MRRTSRLAPWTFTLSMLAGLSAASGVGAQVPDAAPGAAVGLPAVPTVRILAIGRLTAKATPDALRAALAQEVRETVQLQLAGTIDQWFTRQDQPGVVFLLNLSDPMEARRVIDSLSLGKKGLMEFDLIPLGPLAPLALLLGPPR